jgi:hypothetical protein
VLGFGNLLGSHLGLPARHDHRCSSSAYQVIAPVLRRGMSRWSWLRPDSIAAARPSRYPIPWNPVEKPLKNAC